MDEFELNKKWRAVLDYESDTIPRLPLKYRLGCAKELQKYDELYGDKRFVVKKLIPMIRRMYPYHIIERGIYSPIKGQWGHGSSFEALKILNFNQDQSKYEAIPLDEKYSGDDITHNRGYLADYPFDF